MNRHIGMIKPPSAIATQLAAFASVAWSLFIAASVLFGIVVTCEIGDAQIVEWIAGPAARAAAAAMLHGLDAAWIVLAGINTYFHLAGAEGLATARRWSAVVLLTTGAAAWIDARSGWPFGSVVFTSTLGPRIGHVPLALPLLWFVVVLNSRYTFLRICPRASHWQLALGSAALTLLSDLNLEPVAWKMRAWWLWHPLAPNATAWPPWQNYLSWFALSFALMGCLRETRQLVLRHGSDRRPMAIFCTLNAVLLAANVSRLWRMA